MKKLFLSAILALPLICLAQPVNPSFEEWFYSPGAFVNRPIGWTWSDGITSDPDHMFYAQSTGEPYSGDYALKLQVVFGDSKDMAIQHSPITGRPERFKGHYMYSWNTILAPDSSTVTDIAQVTVFMTKWDTDSSKRDTIGFGLLDLGTSENYTEFSVSLNYFNTENPDSVMIFLDPSMMNRIQQVSFTQPNGTSSFFTVDNLRFEGGTLSTQEMPQETILVYPNPATEELFFGDFTGSVSISDMNGKIFIAEREITPNQSVFIGDFSSGVYFVKLAGNGKMHYQKFIKR